MSNVSESSTSEPPLKKRLVCDDLSQNGDAESKNGALPPKKAHELSTNSVTRDPSDPMALDYSSPTLNCRPACSTEAAAELPEDKAASQQAPVAAADFSCLEVVRVLSSSDASCSIALEAKHKTEDGRVLVQLQKTPFDADKLSEVISEKTTLTQLFHNDVYSKHTAELPPHLNKLQVTIIHPAEDKHFQRYEREACCLLEETPEVFRTYTKPFIESGAPHSKQWIYNILDGVSEADRVVLRDSDPQTGFVLLPDLKWTGEQVSDLYCQAIVNRRDLASIRDLTGDCLPLLRNILSEGTKAISRRYGVQKDRLLVYLHYLPSFYHLHVHFSALTFDAPGTRCGKAHALCDVISNLEQNPQHYTHATLAFTLRDNHPHPLARHQRQPKLGD